MRSLFRFVAWTLVIVTLAACGSAPGGESVVGTAELDMFVDGGGDIALSTGPMLDAGRTYGIHVEGTYSIWGQSMWDSGTCEGTPDPAPMYPSPGTTNGTVGIDAEYYYAVPNGSALCSVAYPWGANEFQFSLDGGNDFFNPDPIGGVTAPLASHAYDYEVVGQGHAIQFRREFMGADDYGVLKITVTTD